MKVLHEGDPKKPWWVGRAIRCPQCEFVGQLERTDPTHSAWFVKATPEVVCVVCPRCFTSMEETK